MNHPELYHKGNHVQRYDAERIFSDYATKMLWLRDGGDSLIDLGSGSGDVLMDFVYPRMPRNFQRLVYSDINPIMLSFARQQYAHIDRVQFKLLDMGTHNDLPIDLKGKFDHVTSFYALMYAKSLRQSLRNIYNLLRPEGGDSLIVHVTYHPTYEAYKRTSQMEKWSKYMCDVDSFISPHHNAVDPRREFNELIAETGFSDFSVEMQHKVFSYNSLEVFKANMIAVNPFLDRMPVSMRSEYMDDFLSAIFQIIGLNVDYVDYYGKFPVPYKLLVIYARKSQLM